MNRYTEEELTNIISDYKRGMRPFELSKKYNRTAGSIINKLKSLGEYKDSVNHYSKDDVELMKKLYQVGDWNGIMQAFPNISKSAVYDKMSALKVSGGTKNHWSYEDEKIIRDNYHLCTIDELYKMIDGRHSKQAIETKAFKKFGYGKYKQWSDEEIDIMKKYYSKIPKDKLIEMLPNRSVDGIMAQARKLGLKSYHSQNVIWTREEMNVILENWDKYSDKELASMVGKSWQAVKEKRHQFELYRQDRKIKSVDSYDDIAHYFRGQIFDWKKRSIENSGYSCVLTGSKDFHVHHIVSLSSILKEFFFEFPQYKNIDYSCMSQDQLLIMTSDFLEFHDRYPLGVCVSKELHKLFHNLYGKTNNERQWNDFCERYRKGEFFKVA